MMGSLGDTLPIAQLQVRRESMQKRKEEMQTTEIHLKTPLEKNKTNVGGTVCSLAVQSLLSMLDTLSSFPNTTK